MGSIAIVQDRARDLPYLGWRLAPIYDPDPLSEGVEGIEDDTALLEEQGVRVNYAFKEGANSRCLSRWRLDKNRRISLRLYVVMYTCRCRRDVNVFFLCILVERCYYYSRAFVLVQASSAGRSRRPCFFPGP